MQAIYEGNGCLLGLNIGREWWTNKNGQPSYAEADLLPLRPPATVVNGHAIYVDGYEVTPDARLKVFFMNCWTQFWARDGRGWFYFDEYKNYLTEAWSAIDLPNNWMEIIDQLPSAETFKYYFGVDLLIGAQGDEVKELQTALMIDGVFSQELYTNLLKKDQLGFYGPVTQKAVRDFQFKYKVASLAELLIVNGKSVGSKPRKKLNDLYNK